MGPDGAIYIADWYNPIIQHGEVDFRDPRRDVSHGRIWRITAKGRPLVPRPGSSTQPPPTCSKRSKAPEDWTRHHARRVLKERGSSVLPELKAWTAKQEQEPLLLEALWTYQALDVAEPRLLAALLQAGDYRIRAAAVRVVAAWHDRLPHPLELLAPRVADDEPQVRLEAVRALGRIPSTQAAELALKALDKPVDKYLDYGLWLTLRELEPHWLPAVQQGKLHFGGNSRHLMFALQAADSRAVLPSLVELVRSGKVGNGETDVLALIATLGGPGELALLLDRVVDSARPVSMRLRLLEALEQADRQRNIRPSGDLARIVPLLKADREELRAVAARLTGLWGLEAVRPQLLDYARADKTSDRMRRAALDGLTALGGKASIEALEQLAGTDGPPIRRRMALVALVNLDAKSAAARAVGVLSALPNAEEAIAIYEAFLQRKGGASLLAGALRDQKLPGDVAKIGVRTVRTSGRPDGGLTEALTKAGGLTSGTRTLSPKELQALIADVARLGDPARGEIVYRRKDQVCLKCHAIGGAGGQVGPDLSSIGASAPVDYLIDSLLQPNKAVKENYHSLLISTKKGQQYAGIKVRETKTELILRTAEDQEIAIPVKDIDEQTPGGSLMPEGLTDTLTRGELIDLVRFLSELGKVGPYAIGPRRLVRRWQALDTTREAWGFLLLGGGLATPSKDESGLQWGPLYSTVAGVLPLADAPLFQIGQEKRRVSLVRCQLDVTTPGPAIVRLDSAKGLQMWVDANPVAVKEVLELNLPVGLHTLTFVVDRDVRRDGLRCELEDKPGSPARARIVGGK